MKHRVMCPTFKEKYIIKICLKKLMELNDFLKIVLEFCELT